MKRLCRNSPIFIAFTPIRSRLGSTTRLHSLRETFDCLYGRISKIGIERRCFKNSFRAVKRSNSFLFFKTQKIVKVVPRTRRSKMSYGERNSLRKFQVARVTRYENKNARNTLGSWSVKIFPPDCSDKARHRSFTRMRSFDFRRKTSMISRLFAYNLRIFLFELKMTNNDGIANAKRLGNENVSRMWRKNRLRRYLSRLFVEKKKKAKEDVRLHYLENWHSDVGICVATQR